MAPNHPNPFPNQYNLLPNQINPASGNPINIGPNDNNDQGEPAEEEDNPSGGEEDQAFGNWFLIVFLYYAYGVLLLVWVVDC